MTLTRFGPGARASYHHGNLPVELLRAARSLLETEGADGVTLRAAARAAGVSHAAPQHHFGDLSGLLSELAALGYRELGERLRAAGDGRDGNDRLRALGVAYVEFAVGNPAMFLLMYRSERLDPARPALVAALEYSRSMLARAVGALIDARAGDPAGAEEAEALARGRALRAWSMVHGFSMLLLDGRLDAVADPAPDAGWRKLLAEVFQPPVTRDPPAPKP